MVDTLINAELSRLTVLVVDDNAVNLTLVAKALESRDYQVLVAQSGEEALERVKLILPDLILLDVMMPGIDGFEVCRRFKSSPETQKIPIIFMTALSDMRDKLSAFKAGAVDYITKPVQIDELLARVETQLVLELRRKYLERMVREYRTLAENTPDNIIRYDLNCRAVYANPQIERQVAPKYGSILGKTPEELGIGAVQARNYQEALERVLASGEQESFEIKIDLPDNALMIHQINFVAERDAEGEICGALGIGRDITELKEAELQLEESHAQLQALSRRREVAREEERKHIARELHDDLGQYLTALYLKAAVLQIKLDNENPVVSEILEQIVALVNGMKKTVRNLSHRLRPEIIDLGLEAALESLVIEFNKRYEIDCHIELHKGVDELDEACSIVVYRVAQESLTNIARHAEAKKVTITVDQFNDQLILIVTDDGRGFNMLQRDPESFGLIGMQERIQAVGGELKIISEPQMGTSVIARVPA